MKHIWIKRGLRTQWIKDVESFDIKASMEIGGETFKTHPRFVCKHTDGGMSFTPVPQLLELRWGIIHGDGIHGPNKPVQPAS